MTALDALLTGLGPLPVGGLVILIAGLLLVIVASVDYAITCGQSAFRPLSDDERRVLPKRLVSRPWQWNPAWLFDERRAQRERDEQHMQRKLRAALETEAGR